jgi:hypothetical protein
MPERPALWISPVTVALTESKGVGQIISIPCPANASAAALKSLSKMWKRAGVQLGVLGGSLWWDELKVDDIILLSSPIPHDVGRDI